MADSFPLFQSGRVEVVLATYELALIHATEEVRAIRWGVLVMDEAHKLKNRETKMYKAAIELRNSSQYCVGLTGVLCRGGDAAYSPLMLPGVQYRHAHAEQRYGALLRV